MFYKLHFDHIQTTPESQQKIMEERLRSGDSFIVPSYIKKGRNLLVQQNQTDKTVEEPSL